MADTTEQQADQRADVLLRRLRAILDEDVPTRADFMELAKSLVDYVKGMDSRLSGDFEKVAATLKQISDQIDMRHSSSVSEMKGKLNELFVGDRLREMEKMMRSSVREELDTQIVKVDSKLATVKDGYTPKKGIDYHDGKHADEKGMMAHMMDEMKKMFEEHEKQISKRLASMPRGGRVGMRKVPITQTIRFTTEVDGQNRRFTLPRDTVRVNFGIMSQWPNVLHADDLPLTGNTVVLHESVPTPEAGQTFLINFETLFYA